MFDFLIIGQGLAGTVLSNQLIKEGFKIKVIDDNRCSTSLKIKRGIANPVVFKRLTLSWRVPEIYFLAKNFYVNHYPDCVSQFMIKKRIDTKNEFITWKQKINNLDFLKFLDISDFNSSSLPLFGRVIESFCLDIEKMIIQFSTFLKNRDLLLNDYFNYKALDIYKDSLSYYGLKAKSIIFCQGINNRENPYFSYLPIIPNKGEELTLELEGNHELQTILKKKYFLYPITNNKIKIGSNYERDNLNPEVTDEMKQDFLEEFHRFFPNQKKYKIVNHIFAFRPTTIDRRPILGRHPKYQNMFIVNGFGSKGIMLAPYVAQEFIKLYAQEDSFVNKQIFVERFL